jgi:two-component system phosphate regulon sensor histidine kinase PhoR
VPRLSVIRSRFFWRLYATYAALVLATTTIGGALVDHQMGQALLDELTTSLHDRVLLIEPFLGRSFAAGMTPEAQAEITRLGRGTAARITLIAPDGTVVADSEQDPASMDNQADRPEVRAAASASFGKAQRYSHDVQQDTLYIARAIRDGETVRGVVRAALPLGTIDSRLWATRRILVAGAVIGVLVALIAGVMVARRITVPIAEMTAVAEQMGRGSYTSRLPQSRRDEIGVLGRTLDRLGNEITRRIAMISHDQAQLRAMIAGMVEGVIAVDDEDRVLQCNQAAARLLGIDAVASRGRKLWEIARMTDVVDLLAEARSRRVLVAREVVLHHADGEVVLDAHVSPFAVDGRGGLVVVLHDVSDLRRLERVRRDFVANVSHELKTPLTNIKGYVETLLDGALYDDRHNMRFLRKIDAHVARLGDLVRDLLDLAHIEAREGSLPLSPVDWRPVIEEAVRRHETALEQKGLTCLVQGTHAPAVVRGDRAAMVQVIDNLLDNAIKYTPAGGTISIRLSGDGVSGRLEVEDTGVGVPEEERERIFERFYRVDKARSRDLGGTGLGLAIVKHCAQAMGGEVHVESPGARGSRFVVRLAAAG